MKKRRRPLAALLAGLFIAALCSGCMISAEELYSLPQMPEEYVQLQELVDQRIEEGSSYAAPVGGSNRQSIQLRDLDGDGTAEALAFLADETGTPSVCVYRQDESGDYYLAVIIYGDGSAVAGVDYADLNGDGAAELIIAWQIGGELRQLSVYALDGSRPDGQMQVLSADCTDFLVCDLDADGVADLLDLRLYSAGGAMVMYTLDEELTVSSSTAYLSDRITDVRRTQTGTLSDGTTALFVDSGLSGGRMVTDVLAARNGQIKNLTLTVLGHSSAIRPEGVYAADVNGDRALEVPGGEGSDLVWFSVNAAGDLTPAATAYYAAKDGWYLTLTGPLEGDASAERQGGSSDEQAVVFSVPGEDGAPQRSVLAIYVLTGENRLDRAQASGRFILRQEEQVVYAARLWTDELTQQDIEDNFHLIYADWRSEEL